MDAILDHYGADRIRVSEAGLREGAILAVEHAGQAWRDRLAGPRPGLAGLEPRDDPPERPPEGDAGDAAPRPARSSAAGERPRARD